jgi:hypothetical protein
MAKQIEQLSKDLASGMSRRQAFRRFLAGIGGGLLFTSGRARGEGNNVCVQLCREHLQGRDFGECVAFSAHCPEGQCAFVGTGGVLFCAPVS